MTNVWGRRGISTLLLMQYLLIVVGHGAEGHSLGFSFKTPQVFSLSVSHSAHAKSARRILFRILSPRQDFPLAHQGAGKWKSSLIFFIPFVKEGSRAQSSTHFFDDRSHFVEMTTEMAAPLEGSIPSTRSSHHLPMGSLSSRSIASTRFIFSLFGIWMLTITESWQKLSLCSCSWLQGSTPLVSCLIEGTASSFLTVAFCPPGIFAFSSHPLDGQFFHASLLKLISKHFGVF